jgi:hypothetical protein
MTALGPEGEPLPTFDDVREDVREDFSYPNAAYRAGVIAAVAVSAAGFLYLAKRLLSR